MAELTLPLLGASVFIAALTYLTYRMLGDYLHKWFQMKPIPELEETYPLIGNALLFKPNAGGEEPLQDQLWDGSSEMAPLQNSAALYLCRFL